MTLPMFSSQHLRFPHSLKINKQPHGHPQYNKKPYHLFLFLWKRCLKNWSILDTSCWFHRNHSDHQTQSGMNLTKYMSTMMKQRSTTLEVFILSLISLFSLSRLDRLHLSARKLPRAMYSDNEKFKCRRKQKKPDCYSQHALSF